MKKQPIICSTFLNPRVLCAKSGTAYNAYTYFSKRTIFFRILNRPLEYLQGAFQNAERKTNVEVALVNIEIERKVEEDLFAGCSDKVSEFGDKVDENYEVVTGKHIVEIVAEFNQIVALSMETIVGYYQNHKKVGQYMGSPQNSDNKARLEF